MLDRPRHHDLIEEIRAAGARIKLIQDGDVTASISAAIRGTNDHLAIGIGGTRQAVLSAAALRCLGGELQAQLWPTTRARDRAGGRATGVEDVNRVFSSDDLAPGEVIVVATGVSNGDLLRGVRFLADSARTHSLVMCMRCNWVRFTDGIHFFARERKEEVRLLGLASSGMPATTRRDRRGAAHGRGPELGMDIVELGLFYDVEIDGPKVKVIHSLTSMGCPAGPDDPGGIHDAAASVEGVEEVEVELTFDPPWTPEQMSDDAKFILGFG